MAGWRCGRRARRGCGAIAPYGGRVALPTVEVRGVLQNCWYLAGWSEEVGGGRLLARQIAGHHLVFARAADGRVFALEDMCPHRFAPLSMGRCEAGVITCPYHGLAFGSAGRCVHNPHGPITSALSVRSFPVVERHDALWLWPGSSPSDPQSIPDFSFIDRTAPEARVKGHLQSAVDYRLMVDNIMDLTHADFLHASSLGGGINTLARAQVEQEGDTVTITWTALDDTLAPLHASFVPGYQGRGDLLNQVTWFPPGTMRQRLALSLPGRLETAPLDSMTAHYFFCHTSDGVSANPALAPDVREALLAAFAGEDAPMLAAQARRIAGRDFWSLRPALLPSDRGAVLVRRTLEKLIAAEQHAD
jgi:phenylpropionate dioxygenase-like ring-hydroxylating dioxygenase large terminal subunit